MSGALRRKLTKNSRATAVGGFLDRRNSSASSGNFNNHIGGDDAMKVFCLLEDHTRIAVEPGISLDREPSITSFVGLKNRLKQARSFGRNLPNDLPTNFFLCGCMPFFDQAVNTDMAQTGFAIHALPFAGLVFGNRQLTNKSADELQRVFEPDVCR